VNYVNLLVEQISALYSKYIIFGGMHYDPYTILYQSSVEQVYYGAGIWGIMHTMKYKTSCTK